MLILPSMLVELATLYYERTNYLHQVMGATLTTLILGQHVQIYHLIFVKTLRKTNILVHIA